jgi:hypothetical protein
MFFSAIAMPTRYAGKSDIVQDALRAARAVDDAMRCLRELNRHPQENVEIQDVKVYFD